ncbi:MAG: hypothetical protein IPN29_08320 [Saprospiraceae bacterium]|nr:hypothetical protein [Saprospiraceae bacterium]
MIKFRQYISIFLAVFIYASSAGMVERRGFDIRALDDGSPSYREGGYQHLSGILEKDVNAKTLNSTALKDNFTGQSFKSYDGMFIMQSSNRGVISCRIKSSFQLIHFLLCVHFFQFHSFW